MKRKSFLKPDKPSHPTDQSSPLPLIDDSTALDDFGQQITSAWGNTVGNIVRTGELLIRAKKELGHGKWLELFDNHKAPFSERTAQRLMAIARHPVLSNPTHASHLPASWATLYELTTIADQALEQLLAESRIDGDTTREDVKEIKAKLKDLGLFDFSALNHSLQLLDTFRTSDMWAANDDLLVVLMGGPSTKQVKQLMVLADWIQRLSDCAQRQLEEDEESRQQRQQEAWGIQEEAERKRYETQSQRLGDDDEAWDTELTDWDYLKSK